MIKVYMEFPVSDISGRIRVIETEYTEHEVENVEFWYRTFEREAIEKNGRMFISEMFNVSPKYFKASNIYKTCNNGKEVLELIYKGIISDSYLSMAVNFLSKETRLAVFRRKNDLYCLHGHGGAVFEIGKDDILI